MPKVIENIKEQILAISKEEIQRDGYNSFELRTIAAKCSIAVGTIYNYFGSKMEIAATIMLDDWIVTYQKMLDDVVHATGLYKGLQDIFNELADFSIQYEEILGNVKYLTDEMAKPSNNNRKDVMEKDMEKIILSLLQKYHYETSDFELAFIAQAFLYYVLKRDFSYSKLDSVIEKILEK